MTPEEQIAAYNKDRNEALLSLDEQKIRAFMEKWNVQTTEHPETFWCGVHKAITAINALPLEQRLKSKLWLDQRGWKSLDDGDLGK